MRSSWKFACAGSLRMTARSPRSKLRLATRTFALTHCFTVIFCLSSKARPCLRPPHHHMGHADKLIAPQSNKIRDQPCLRASLLGTKGCSVGPWSMNLSWISSIPRLRRYHHKVPATNIHVTAKAGNFQPKAYATPEIGRSNRSMKVKAIPQYCKLGIT
jgi:hypothetical protein